MFLAYFLFAARPVPPETVLVPLWLSSFESETPVKFNNNDYDYDNNKLIPFKLDNRFGYFDHGGNFSINRIIDKKISFSENLWAEYDDTPDSIQVKNSSDEITAFIENPRGYPFFMDNRTFLVSNEQNAVSGVDTAGNIIWTYEFSGILTCADAASGLLISGSLDGITEVLNDTGKQIFSFEPGGSRYPVILGCAVSDDGSRMAIISGIEKQRFLLLERFGAKTGDYKVVYHEFLDNGFRRPVHITFTGNGKWIIFEQSGGLGIYETGTRQLKKVALDGEIIAMDTCGTQGFLFTLVSGAGSKKKLVGIKLPGRVMIEMPFNGKDVFFNRCDSQLFIGGEKAIISFNLDKR